MSQSDYTQPEAVRQYLAGLPTESSQLDAVDDSRPASPTHAQASPSQVTHEGNEISTLVGDTVFDDTIDEAIDDAEFDIRLELETIWRLLNQAERKAQRHEFESAVDYYTRGLVNILRLPEPRIRTLPILQFLHDLSLVYLETNRMKDAEVILYLVVQSARSGCPSIDDTLLASYQYNLARIATQNRYYQDARDLCAESKAITQRVIGENAPISENIQRCDILLSHLSEVERMNNHSFAGANENSETVHSLEYGQSIADPSRNLPVMNGRRDFALDDKLSSLILFLSFPNLDSLFQANDRVAKLSILKPAGLWRFSFVPTLPDEKQPTPEKSNLQLRDIQVLLNTTRSGETLSELMTKLLYRAIWHEDLEVIEYLLERGVEVNARGGPDRDAYLNALRDVFQCGDWTPINYAAALRKPELVSKLLQRGADLCATTTYKGDNVHKYVNSRTHAPGHLYIPKTYNALGWAIQGTRGFSYAGESNTTVKMLAAAGADVNDAGDGLNPLDQAIRDENIQLARTLLDCGGKPLSEPGELALSVIKKHGNIDHCIWTIFDELKVDFTAIPAVLKEAFRADIERKRLWRFNGSPSDLSVRVENLLKRGVSLESCPNALRCAIHNRSLRLVKTLHEYGADLNQEDSEGLRPLDWCEIVHNSPPNPSVLHPVDLYRHKWDKSSEDVLQFLKTNGAAHGSARDSLWKRISSSHRAKTK